MPQHNSSSFTPYGFRIKAFNDYSRRLLVSYHGVGNARATCRCVGGRMTRREPAG